MNGGDGKNRASSRELNKAMLVMEISDSVNMLE